MEYLAMNVMSAFNREITPLSVVTLIRKTCGGNNVFISRCFSKADIPKDQLVAFWEFHMEDMERDLTELSRRGNFRFEGGIFWRVVPLHDGKPKQER